MIMESIGKKIEKLRKSAGITQEELAFELDVSRQAVYQWESNTSIPKADKLKLLCKYFNVKPDYFLFENSPAQTLANAEQEIAVTAVEEKETIPKKSNKKTVLITCAVVIALLAAAIMLFIAWLATPSKDAADSVLISAWNFDIVTILQIIAGIILFAVVCVIVFLLVKYLKNRKK